MGQAFAIDFEHIVTLWLIELRRVDFQAFQAALAVAKQERPCFTQTCVAISLSLQDLNWPVLTLSLRAAQKKTV